jgi:3D-(3,5/4)-trihydroxycyclohexane-1,2-dione acylhydrolase (decyclizing)
MGLKLDIVLLDNRGFGCINRLQQSVGGAPFNNLLADSRRKAEVAIDFAAHGASMGAQARKVGSIAELEAALEEAKAIPGTTLTVIETDPALSTAAGGAWWEVPVAEVSTRPQVEAARRSYDEVIHRRDGK